MHNRRWRLAGMMALIYAIQGAWWPLLAVHLKDLGISSRGRGWIFATMALASIATPLGVGQVADRLMATQRLLAIIYAVGTGFLGLMAAGVVGGEESLFVLFLIYWLVTAPSYGLSSSLALRNLERPREQFGGVRLWGTVGWMVVGWLVSGVMCGAGSTRAGQGVFEAFGVAAVLSAAFAAYCLTLPDTPPLARSRRGIGWSEAKGLLREPAVAVYLGTAFGVSLTTPFVYQVLPGHLEALGLERSWIALALSLGQVLEIFGLALLPRMLCRFGYRGTLAVGLGVWTIRYISLALGLPLGWVIAGSLLHGVAFACFQIGGQVFLDSRAPAHLRASAQSLNVLVTAGIGSLLGNLLAGEVANRAGGDEVGTFVIPAIIDAVLFALWVWGFRPLTAYSPVHVDRMGGDLPTRETNPV